EDGTHGRQQLVVVAMLAGARQHGDDDQLLTSMSAVLDALYAHFSSAPAAPASP
ncbi:MAG: hypothetical protein JWP34_3847, partial [Massilia sp.]|nr:hypothetical protein [Massilia sp.]